MIDISKYTTIMSSILKEGAVGNFQLRKKIIPKGTWISMYDSKRGRIYKDFFGADFPIVSLSENEDIWMSDSPFEQESLKPTIARAKGEILVCGLGIGLLPTMIEDKPKVKHIDIVEMRQEVGELVFEQIKTAKMKLIIADAWQYLREIEEKYDFIYIDVWGEIIAPIMQIKNSIELANKCLKLNGQVRFWMQELYERIIDKLPQKPIFPRDIVFQPCLICGKTFRYDYAGLCMDCADGMGVSELWMILEKSMS